MKITSASTTTKTAIRFLLACLFFSSLASGQTTSTLSKLRASSYTSQTTVYRIGKDLYIGTADKQSNDNGTTIIVNKKGLRYYKLQTFQEVPDVSPVVVTYKNTAQSYTANCPSGTTGSAVTATVTAGTIESAISVAEANRLALLSAQQKAELAQNCTAIPPPPSPKVGKRAQGFSTYTTTGSIEAGSDVLTLDAPMQLQAGDVVAVFTNAARGQRGVGGQYPNTWYASIKERDADKSQPAGTWASVVGVEGLFRFNDTWNDATYTQPLFDKTVPLSLEASVVEFLNSDHTQVRLSKKAAVSTTGAKVTLDNTQTIIDYVKNRRDKTFDAKALGFGAGDTLYFGRVKWEGQEWNLAIGDWFYAKDITLDLNGVVAASVPGAFPASFAVEYGNGGFFILRHAKIIQNGTYEGMGFPNEARFEVPQAAESWGNPWLYCQAFFGGVADALAEDVVVENPLAYGFHSGRQKRCGVYNTADGIKTYNGFWFLTFSGDIEDCWANSKYLIRVLEIEGGDGGHVKNFSAINGIIASNSSWNATFENINLSFTKNAALGNPALLANPTIEVHAHIKGSAGNILFDGVNINYEGYLDEEGGLLRDFSTKAGVNGLTVRHVNINKPPILQPYGRGNGYGSTFTGAADNVLIEDFYTNATMGKGFGCEGFGHDNIAIDLTGKNPVVRRTTAEAIILSKEGVVEDSKFVCPVKRY